MISGIDVWPYDITKHSGTKDMILTTRRHVSRSSWIVGLAGLGLVTTMSANATPPPVYYLSTGQTGAQTQIDAFHTTSWGFTASSSWSLGGGDFTMKDGGSGTVDDVMLSVYLGDDATGLLVASLDLTVAQFCALHGGNCQSYASTPFHFVDAGNLPAPYTFTAGLDYFIALTSTAPDQQSEAYFIKGLDTSSFLDSQGNPLPDQTLSVTDVKEPMSAAIFISGVVGTALGRKRRARRTDAKTTSDWAVA